MFNWSIIHNLREGNQCVIFSLKLAHEDTTICFFDLETTNFVIETILHFTFPFCLKSVLFSVLYWQCSPLPTFVFPAPFSHCTIKVHKLILLIFQKRKCIPLYNIFCEMYTFTVQICIENDVQHKLVVSLKWTLLKMFTYYTYLIKL